MANGPTKKDDERKKLERVKGVRARVSEAEYAAIQERAHNAGLSTAAYLRACALGDSGPRSKRAPPVNRELLGAALADLRRVGNNLNQIAHHLNAGGYPERAPMADARAELIACIQIILESLGRAA